MKIKSLMHKALGVLALLPMLPALASAFAMDKARRADYHGMTPHAHWDEVWNETMWDITIIGAIYIGVALVFMFIYRRKAHGERGHWPTLSGQAKLGWLIIPVMLFLGDDLYLFVKGWDLHNHYREVPADAAEVKLTGSMWSWTYELENGIETYDELVVPAGKPVILRMSSDDVVHSHYMNRYRVTEDLMPGRVTYQWFLPTEEDIGAKSNVVTCREYCGEGHSKMFGKVRVLSQADYESWVGSQLGEAPGDEAKTVAAKADGDGQPDEKQI